MRVLLSRVPDSTPAAVVGWRVAALPGRVYPVLVPAEVLAKGRLVTGLAPQDWRTLDAFEDPAYDLHPLTLTDGREGWAYVCCDHASASPGDWDMDAFERDHLTAYLKRCAAWRQRYETSHPGPANAGTAR